MKAFLSAPRSLTFILLIGYFLGSPVRSVSQEVPRVIVILDACLSCANPDDVHSLVYLLWNADRLEVEGIIPDSYDSLGQAQGLDAIHRVLDAYEADYDLTENAFEESGFPPATELRNRVAVSLTDAIERIRTEARKDDPRPLYVLNWGNMRVIKETLMGDPPIAHRLRLISIASRTGTEDCHEKNRNSWGRDTLFRDSRFRDLWWLEMDWTQEAIHAGEEPVKILNVLTHYGSLGRTLGIRGNESRWSEGFRAGDAVSFLYLLDPDGVPDDPSHPSWVGRFPAPFPETRPHYFTDDPGPIDWDFEKPCRTWIDRELFRKHCQKPLLENRSRIDSELLGRLNGLYASGAASDSMAFYEAENAKLTEGLQVKADLEASHGFYVEMRESGKITWILEDVPEDGTYRLTIRYKLPFLHKSQRLIVNGEDIGSVKFDGPPRTWQEKELSLNLHRGRNTVTVEKDWGYMDFDTVTLIVGKP